MGWSVCYTVHNLQLLCSKSEAYLVLGTANYIHLFLFIKKAGKIIHFTHQ